MHEGQSTIGEGRLLDEMTRTTVCELLVALSNAEFWVRKYRIRAEVQAKTCPGRSSPDYDRMAVQEDSRVAVIRTRLEILLGPEASSSLPLFCPLEEARRRAVLFRDIDDPVSFDEACFFARHPTWAVHDGHFKEAHERWKNDPRFHSLFPHFTPILPGWID